MQGQQHVHAEGEITVNFIDRIGRSTRGNEKAFEGLCEAIEKTILEYDNGSFSFFQIEHTIDNETRGCC